MFGKKKEPEYTELTGLLGVGADYHVYHMTKKDYLTAWLIGAARMNGLSYSKFMYGLKSAGVEMNRKMLAELAVNDAAAFTALAETAKKALNK